MTSYRAFNKLMAKLPAEEHGVRMRTANFFFEAPIESMPGQLEKMQEIEAVTEVCQVSFATLVAKRGICYRFRASSATRS